MTAGAEVRGFRDEWRQERFGSRGGCWDGLPAVALGAKAGARAARGSAAVPGLGARGSGLAGARNRELLPAHSARTSKTAGVFTPAVQITRFPSPAFAPEALREQADYLRLVTWSQMAAPPPPMAAPMSAPFLPPMAAPTPAPAPAEDPMMMALFATERVLRTGRSS